MTKAVSNRDICFTKAVLLWCEHGQCSLNFVKHGAKQQLGKIVHKTALNTNSNKSLIERI